VKFPPCTKSWLGTLGTAGAYIYAHATLNNIALIVAILSGLMSMTLTLLTIRKTLRSDEPKDDARR
jgi:hypothetical protein